MYQYKQHDRIQGSNYFQDLLFVIHLNLKRLPHCICLRCYSYAYMFGKLQKNRSNTDLIITNPSFDFQSTGVAETGLSDFHKMSVAV